MKRELELAWLAGLIDGEGCISLTPSIRIVLVERDKFVLEKVIEITGAGNLNFRPLNKKNPNWNNQYCWNLYKKKDVVRVAREVLPYLVLKKREMEIMLEAFEARVKARYGL